jgi:hypothetical protein
MVEPPEPLILPVKPRVVAHEEPDIITLKPRSQPLPVKLVKVEEESDDDDPFWFNYELEDAPVQEPIESVTRLWSEIENIRMPLDGEPHDLWWDERESESPWIEQ